MELAHHDSNEEQPCVLCETDPDIKDPTRTTNRATFNVNARYSTEPICEDHDDTGEG